MEASGGALLEHVVHTHDDTVKLIAAATEVLKTEAAKHQISSFSAYLKLKVLTVHTAKNVMTLSSVSYTDQKNYKVMELSKRQSINNCKRKEVNRTNLFIQDFETGERYIRQDKVTTVKPEEILLLLFHVSSRQ